MSERSAEYQIKLQESTTNYLNKLQDQEHKMQVQLEKVNPDAAKRVFENSQKIYEKLQNDLMHNSENVLKSCGKYVPGIDSAITSLKFLQLSGVGSTRIGDNLNQAKAALAKVKQLEDQFKKSDNVEEFLKQREEFLKQQLTAFHVPGLDKYNQLAAYYAQQMEEYKQAWEDPTKMEAKAMNILNKIPAFQDFMQKNSMIAGLFNIPSDYATSGVAGLQTKEEVQKVMEQNMALMGPKGAQGAQQNIGDGQSALASVRNKLNQGSSELAMPPGHGNSQPVSYTHLTLPTILRV